MAIYTKPVMPRKPAKPGMAKKIGAIQGKPMTKGPSASQSQAKAMKQKQELKKRAISKSR